MAEFEKYFMNCKIQNSRRNVICAIYGYTQSKFFTAMSYPDSPYGQRRRAILTCYARSCARVAMNCNLSYVVR